MLTGFSANPENRTGQRVVRHPRRQRPGPQQKEVRVRRIGAGFPEPPHICRRYRPLRNNVQVILFLH